MDMDLNKSIDSLIDELFSEETIVKSMIKDDKPEEETADEALAKLPKMAGKIEDDAKRGEGRPKQISEVPDEDMDGKRAGDYDDDITEEESETKPAINPEQKQDKLSEMGKSLSKAEFDEYMELKKAKAASEKEELLMKAKKEQADLIKSAVRDAVSELRKENDELRKSVSEQANLLKSMANRPREAKAITHIEALEKSSSNGSSKVKLSKAELLDVAEEMIKSRHPEFTAEHGIELETTGRVFEEAARNALEREVAKRFGRR